MNTAFFPTVVAACISCGCTDDQACAGGCSWLRVNYEDGVGVCSSCPDACAAFDRDFVIEDMAEEKIERLTTLLREARFHVSEVRQGRGDRELLDRIDAELAA